MQHIQRKRNSGKTTILLHHMVVDPFTLYVARTTAKCERTMELAKELGLNLSKERFVSAGLFFDKDYSQYKILVDDADYIVDCHPGIGYKLLSIASVITTSRDG